MTGRSGGSDAPDDTSSAPIDFDRLEVVAERLSTDDRFDRVAAHPEFTPDRVVCVYDPGFYPRSVHEARLEVVWFENGDFTLHYHEDHAEGAFDHRWDRHPSTHNACEHVHPGPDANAGIDTSFPPDWRDVLSSVLTEIEGRQRGFWTE